MDLLFVKKEHRARDYWSSLLWNMANEDKTQYDSLRSTEVVEFFYLFKTYAKNIEKKKSGLINKQKKQNGR